MSVVLAHLRAEARRRWPAWVGVVLLVGALGGVVIGTVAGTRRTATAYDRMVASAEAWDVLVNPNMGAESAVDVEQVAALAQVREVGALDGGPAALLDDEGNYVDGPLILAARDDAVLVDYARPHVVEGSLFDPDDPEAIMVSDGAAEDLGLAVGDPVTIGTATIEEIVAWEEAGAQGPPPLEPRPARVDAIIVSHDEIVVDEAFDSGHVYLSSAFAERHGIEPFFYGLAVRLHNGQDDVPEFRDAVRALAPDEAIEFKTLAAVEDTVRRGTRPHVVALLVFALVVGVAGAVVAAQAVSRQLGDLGAEWERLQALGLDRRRLVVAAALRVGILMACSIAVAIVGALALSPLFPVGVASRAEIEPGLAADPVVLLLGGAVMLLVVGGPALLGIRTMGRRRLPAEAREQTATARIVTVAPGPVASMGLRAALSPPSRSRGSARGATAGLAMAVAALAAAMTFGASLDNLVASPADFGWNWRTLIDLDVDDPAAAERYAAATEDAEGLSGWSRLSMDQVRIETERIPAVGVDYREGDVGPTIIAGRRPDVAGEIALGGRTMDRLGVGLGDRVSVGSSAEQRTLEIVGQAVFAGLGTYPGADRTELGKGALLQREELAALSEGFGFESLVLDSPDPVALDAAVETVLAVGEDGAFVHDAPERPADIQSLQRVRSTPTAIAGTLALLGSAALALVLVSGVRSRRRELALLKIFGFSRRQVAATVAWQATATAALAVIFGIPAGIVIGRSSWSLLADQLGVADVPRIPLSLIVLTSIVVVVANLVAVVPASIAARTRPGIVLRAE